MSKILQRFFGVGYRALKMIRLLGLYLYGGVVYHVGLCCVYPMEVDP